MNFTQEQISIINSQEHYKSVLGVPGCGKTTVLCAELILDNNMNKLCITRTNSVIEQINNKCNTLNFKKINNSNHFHCNYLNNNIGISNIDSFIHYQLDIFAKNSTYFTDNDINFYDFGVQYEWKKTTLLKLIKNKNITTLYLKTIDKYDKINKIEVNKLYIDEAQDMIPKEINLFIEILKNNKLIQCCVYGDTLQTLSCESTKKYSILSFTKELNASEYNLSKCFRCPRSHVEFNNELFKSIRSNDKYGTLPSLVHCNDNLKDKPFIFSQRGMSSNSNSESIYKSIKLIITEVLKNDTTIDISDVTIIVNRVNANNALPTINYYLNRDFNNKFHYFETNNESFTTPIDFNKVKSTHCKCRDAPITLLKKKCKLYNLTNYSKLNKSDIIVKLSKYFTDNNIVNDIEFKKFKDKENECNTCRFKKIKEKGAIISINGFKGLESKCVIYLNLADKSIPRENHIDKLEELTDYSKLNVLTSRSTKYLFIGINELSPSRYFNEKQIEIFNNKNLIYYPSNWKFKIRTEDKYFNKEYSKYSTFNKESLLNTLDKLNTNNSKNNKIEMEMEVIKKYIKNFNIIDNIPIVYKNIMNKMCDNKIPASKSFRNLDTPDNNALCVSKIVEDIDFIDNIKYTIEETKFGTQCNIDKKYDRRIMGNMGNIIILRDLYLKNKLNTDYKNTIQVLTHLISGHVTLVNSDDIYIYNHIIDSGINKFYNDDDSFNYMSIMKNICDKISHKGTEILTSNCDKYFKLYDNREHNNLFCIKEFLNIDDIKKFLDTSIPNNKLPSRIYFNIAILIESLFEPVFRPINIQYINIFNEDISIIHSNISNITSELNNTKLEQSIGFRYNETNSTMLEELKFNRRINPEIFKEGYECSLTGQCDIIEHKNDGQSNLIEIKTSSSDTCKNSWCYQVILYYMMNDIKQITFNNMNVINILSGINYKITLTTQPNKTTILKKILKYYNYMHSLPTNFLNEILY